MFLVKKSDKKTHQAKQNELTDGGLTDGDKRLEV